VNLRYLDDLTEAERLAWTQLSERFGRRRAEWIARNDTLSDFDRRLIWSHTQSFANPPTFSILMPVYNTPGQFLD
jgi:O-antigen biosynthesis protein